LKVAAVDVEVKAKAKAKAKKRARAWWCRNVGGQLNRGMLAE
jgi:hypothetical protein